VPLSLVLEGANRHDSVLFEATLNNYVLCIEKKGQHMCGDKGYDSEEIRKFLLKKGMIPHIKSRGEEIEEKKEGKSAKRWVVERTTSWINQFRRLKIRWEKKSRNYEGFCHLAFAVIAFRHAGVLG